MLIVDAYNVLHVTGILPPEIAGIDVRGLAHLVLASRWGQSQARLICDGSPPAKGVGPKFAGDAGRLRIVYVGGKSDADSKIEEIINQSTAPRRLTIVSSDRRLRAAARRRRAKWLSSEDFLQALTDDWRKSSSRRPSEQAHPMSGPLTPPETAEWMEEFGVVPESESTPEPVQPRSSDPPPIDPRLAEEIQSEWPGEVDPDDLDMSKWLPPDDTQSGTRPEG